MPVAFNNNFSCWNKPLAGCKCLPGEINSHNVRTQYAHAPTGPESDSRTSARIEVVEAFQGLEQFLPAQLPAGQPECFHQGASGAKGPQLKCRMAQDQLPALQHASQLALPQLAGIGRQDRKRNEDFTAKRVRYKESVVASHRA